MVIYIYSLNMVTTTTTTYPDVICASWAFGFIDDELAEIPQRVNQLCQCKFIKTGDFYESRIILQPTDPYHLKNSTLTHGLMGNISLSHIVQGKIKYFAMIFIHNLPPSEFESHLDGKSYKVPAFIPSNTFADTAVDFRYTFTSTKHTKVLTGYELKVPVSAMENFIDYHRIRVQQQNGI